MTPAYPLVVDTSMDTAGGTVTNVVISGSLGAGSVGGGTADIEWMVADQLGTPRMILDKTGSLAGVKRHDYLPFGEELFAGQGSRTGPQGYSVNDGVRQKFTSKERDNETGLDYFGSRYYSSIQGRFISADAPFVDQRQSSPQSWNLYLYGANNPIRFTDPDGLAHWDKNGNFVGDSNGEYNADLEAVWHKTRKGGYWDFEQGARVASQIFGAQLAMDGNYFRALVHGAEEQVAREARFDRWLAEYNWKHHPHVYADTIILFGPITEGLLPAAEEPLQLGTARMNLLNAAENPRLSKFVNYLYRAGAKIGNGSTADAIRYERETGELLSPAGHIQKGREALSGLDGLLRSGKLSPKDAEIAQQIVADLKDALK